MIKNWGASIALAFLVIIAVTWPIFDTWQKYHSRYSSQCTQTQINKENKISEIIIVGRRIDRFLHRHNDAISATSSFIIMIFTGVLAWKTWGLHIATRGLQKLGASQSEDMGKSIAESARAASAMENISTGIKETVAVNKTVIDNQKEFWARQMRAYVSIDSGSYRRQKGRFRFEFKPNLTNNGATPANNLFVISKCEIVDKPIPENFDFVSEFENTDKLGRTTIFPRQTKFHYNILYRKSTIAEMRMLLAGKAAFHLWGYVSYDDVFNVNRITNFSYLIYVPINKRGTPNWTYTERHNDAT